MQLLVAEWQQCFSQQKPDMTRKQKTGKPLHQLCNLIRTCMYTYSPARSTAKLCAQTLAPYSPHTPYWSPFTARFGLGASCWLGNHVAIRPAAMFAGDVAVSISFHVIWEPLMIGYCDRKCWQNYYTIKTTCAV
jgi:hypothetical protein